VDGVAGIATAQGVANGIAAERRIADRRLRARGHVEGVTAGIALREARRPALIASARVAVHGLAQARVKLFADWIALRMAAVATGFAKAKVVARGGRVRIAATGAALAEVKAVAADPGARVLGAALGRAMVTQTWMTLAEIETVEIEGIAYTRAHTRAAVIQRAVLITHGIAGERRAPFRATLCARIAHAGVLLRRGAKIPANRIRQARFALTLVEVLAERIAVTGRAGALVELLFARWVALRLARGSTRIASTRFACAEVKVTARGVALRAAGGPTTIAETRVEGIGVDGGALAVVELRTRWIAHSWGTGARVEAVTCGIAHAWRTIASVELGAKWVARAGGAGTGVERGADRVTDRRDRRIASRIAQRRDCAKQVIATIEATIVADRPIGA